MKLSQVFPSKWLKATDLQGRKVGVTIHSCELTNIGDDHDKLVVYFQGKEKGLVCNVTNANTIAEIAGSEDTDDWVGIKISLYSTKVNFQGRRVDAIRVDYPINGQPPQVQASKQQRQSTPLPPHNPDPDPDPGMDDDVPW